MITVSTIVYLGVGETPYGAHNGGIEDNSNNPFIGEDEGSLIQEISDHLRSVGGHGIEEYWLKGEVLYVKTEDVYAQEREGEEGGY